MWEKSLLTSQLNQQITFLHHEMASNISSFSDLPEHFIPKKLFRYWLYVSSPFIFSFGIYFIKIYFLIHLILYFCSLSRGMNNVLYLISFIKVKFHLWEKMNSLWYSHIDIKIFLNFIFLMINHKNNIIFSVLHHNTVFIFPWCCRHFFDFCFIWNTAFTLNVGYGCYFAH